MTKFDQSESDAFEHEFNSASLTALFESSLDAIILANSESKYLKVNPAACQMFGRSKEQMIGKRIEDFVPVDQKEKANNQFKIFKISEKETNEFEIIRGDGETRILEYSATANFVPGIHAAFMRDVTDQRRAEEQLKKERMEAEARRESLYQFFSSVPASVAFLRGPEHTFEFINETFIKEIHRNPLGQTAANTFRLLDPKIIDLLNHVYKSGERFVGAAFPLSADWEGNNKIILRYYTFIYEPVRDVSGLVSGIWVLAFDVTQNKLLQSRIKVTEKMASLGTMAAGIAHEINNPLSFALANLDLATEQLSQGADCEGPKVVLEMLKTSEKGLQRVKEIVKSLKIFSRQEEDIVELLDINDVLRFSVRLAQNEIRHRAQLVESYEDVPNIYGNSVRLGQVFTNFLINAVQAVPEGSVGNNKISVGTKSIGPDYVSIEIADTGCGIKPEDLDRIFDPFFTTKPVGVGTGLGLSICHEIIESMNGQINVRSSVSAGSTFEILIPLKQKARALLNTNSEKAQILNNKPLRILVIDDEPEIGEIVSKILAKDHHKVTLCQSAQKALELLQSETYDRILCDVMMPDISGKDFYEKVQKMGRGLEDQVIMMTGGAFASNSQDWLEKIPNSLLEKPFSIQRLRDLVQAGK